MTIAPEPSRIAAATEAPRAKRPRLIAGGAGTLGQGLAQPSNNPTLRLPDVILAFNEWQLKQGRTWPEWKYLPKAEGEGSIGR